jgi:vacuolar-type H+-ATPase subunit F/Vma7
MRLIAMGSTALVEGFALLGFETRADATTEDVDGVLAELLRGNEKALLFLENSLVSSTSRYLERVRREGGRIVVTEIPRLDAPGDYRPPVEALVTRVLGASALEERT